jgi:fatty-acid desaturase
VANIEADLIGARTLPLAYPPTTKAWRINWPMATGVVVVHLLTLLACLPYFFSWIGVALVFVGNYIFCSIGIGAGYHRCLTHRAFQCPKLFERTLALLGVCTLQESPALWVAIHRMHHQHADDVPDPHSPLVTFFWGHMGWLFIVNSQFERAPNYERYAQDLLRDPFYRRLERNELWFFVYAAHALIILAIGFGAGWLWTGNTAAAFQFGMSVLVWGVFVRTVYCWHITWGVNSVAHMWGYRNYETGEDSRNNWLIAIATNGEGWHNNHHADSRSAAHGFHRWWEIDITYLTIMVWERFGLVWNVVHLRPERAARANDPASGARFADAPSRERAAAATDV